MLEIVSIPFSSITEEKFLELYLNRLTHYRHVPVAGAILTLQVSYLHFGECYEHNNTTVQFSVTISPISG
jgi:hypothetical protein